MLFVFQSLITVYNQFLMICFVLLLSLPVLGVTVLRCLRMILSFFYSSNPAHRYYLATDPVTGDLYVSDTNTRRIYRPKSLTGTKDLTKNAEVVAGTGEQCLPFDEARCGDGGKAIEATLMSPKGTGIYQFEDFFLLKK